MPLIRLILLLIVLGSLSLLLVQNWSPVLPLVFLAWRTQPLPLAIWILISLVAGAVTAGLIAGLFQLSSYFSRSSSGQRRQSEVVTPPPRSDNTQGSEPRYTAPNPPPADEWESDSTNNNDDWNFEEKTDQAANVSEQNHQKDSTTYEVNTPPKTGSRSGSVYSYSYREPKNSGVGKTESIFDADYRVLTPPYQPPQPAKDEDDWGFEDDEDFNSEDENDSPQQWR